MKRQLKSRACGPIMNAEDQVIGSCNAESDPFYSEGNLQYLESVMQDVKDGKAHFAEHDLIEDD